MDEYITTGGVLYKRVEMDEYITIGGVLYKRVEMDMEFEGTECPHCGSQNLKTFPAEDEKIKGTKLLPRTGCMNCSKWLEPTRLLFKASGEIRGYW